MIKTLPVWAKIAWWASVVVILGLAIITVDTLAGINSGRYDSMAFLVFNYLVIPVGGLLVLVWAIVFVVRRKK